MAALVWDKEDERTYEVGVDHGVLYIPDAGEYGSGVVWNGLTSVSETPSGAEPSPIYADNMKYLNLMSVEEFGGTIEAITFPIEFYQFDGGAIVKGGIVVGQQGRAKFGLCYRTLIGDAVIGDQKGYKLHLVYGAQAAPSERVYNTINDSPETATFSWEFTTTAVQVEDMKPTALLTIDSTKVVPSELSALETKLYGKGTETEASLPLPDDVLALFPTSGDEVGG
jgi:hypothetical protein